MTSSVDHTCRLSACAFYQLLHVYLYGWQLETSEVHTACKPVHVSDIVMYTLGLIPCCTFICIYQ